MASPLEQQRARERETLEQQRARERERLRCLAHMAQRLERGEDLFKTVNTLAKEHQILTDDEHDLFCVAYIKVFGDKHKEIRILEAAAKEDGLESHGSIIQEYRERIKTEMLKFCLEGAGAVEEYLLPNCPSLYNNVLYHKMLGDIYWFQYMLESEAEKDNLLDKALKAYEEALKKSESLSPAAGIRLAIVLNLSALMYDETDEKNRAILIAEKSITEAQPDVGELDDQYMGLSVGIIQLIQENMVRWCKETADDTHNDKAPLDPAPEEITEAEQHQGLVIEEVIPPDEQQEDAIQDVPPAEEDAAAPIQRRHRSPSPVMRRNVPRVFLEPFAFPPENKSEGKISRREIRKLQLAEEARRGCMG